MTEPFAPQLVIGDIVLEQEIARGGQAVVWRAKECSLPGRPLAVKLVALRFEDRDDHHAAAHRTRAVQKTEATAWGRFTAASNVVPLYGCINEIVEVGPQKWIILGFKMPLSDIGDLGKFISDGRHRLIDRKELRGLLLGIARGLKSAHDLDVSHCDIKPVNVLLFTENGALTPKIMDFGLSTEKTFSNNEGGTPEYMAPERFQRDRQFSLDELKVQDVYSLGVLFYELSTGVRPYCCSDWESADERWNAYARLHAEGEIDVSTIKDRLDTRSASLIQRMLDPDPTRRIPLHRVISELDRQVVDSLTSRGSREIVPILRPGLYRWNINVHQALGNELHIYLLRGKAPAGDRLWIENHLREIGVHGYSLYRVLGGYDYLLRVWIKPTYANLLARVLKEFENARSGVLRRMRVLQQNLFQKSRRLNDLTKEALLQSLASLASQHMHGSDLRPTGVDDEAAIFSQLRKMGYVTSMLDKGKQPARVRFFVTLLANRTMNATYWQAVAERIRYELKGRVHELSTYAGEGDFPILCKFRLRRFLQFADIYKALNEIVAEVRLEDVEITCQTYADMDKEGLVESDDGSIIMEASKYYKEHFV